MQGVKHYLVDELLPQEEFHIVKFQQMAKAAMEEIYAKGKIPVLVGGTGFYIQAITKDIDLLRQSRKTDTVRSWNSLLQRREMNICIRCFWMLILSVPGKSTPIM